MDHQQQYGDDRNTQKWQGGDIMNAWFAHGGGNVLFVKRRGLIVRCCDSSVVWTVLGGAQAPRVCIGPSLSTKSCVDCPVACVRVCDVSEAPCVCDSFVEER